MKKKAVARNKVKTKVKYVLLSEDERSNCLFLWLRFSEETMILATEDKHGF